MNEARAMTITVRTMQERDRAAWAGMRAALWPEADEAAHLRDLSTLLSQGDYWGFMAEAGGVAVGFAEIGLRRYANGCEESPVPFLEGIWVRPECRRQGAGGTMLRAIEDFLRARGFMELGSDSEIDRRAAHEAHRAWGFDETERVVYFRKSL
jgi:aminoglycoside 6'-N-acetyltransferase I